MFNGVYSQENACRKKATLAFPFNKCTSLDTCYKQLIIKQKCDEDKHTEVLGQLSEDSSSLCHIKNIEHI